jgi:hypothetical protein
MRSQRRRSSPIRPADGNGLPCRPGSCAKGARRRATDPASGRRRRSARRSCAPAEHSDRSRDKTGGSRARNCRESVPVVLVERITARRGDGWASTAAIEQASANVPVVPQRFRRLDDDEVQADRERWQRCSAAKAAERSKAERCRLQAGELAMVHGLLRQARIAPSTKPNLDDDKRTRRPGINRDEIELGAANQDVAPTNDPAIGDQLGNGTLLGTVPGCLGVRPHPWRITCGALRRMHSLSPPDQSRASLPRAGLCGRPASQAGARVARPSMERSSTRSAESASTEAPSSKRSSGSWSPASVR